MYMRTTSIVSLSNLSEPLPHFANEEFEKINEKDTSKIILSFILRIYEQIKVFYTSLIFNSSFG